MKQSENFLSREESRERERESERGAVCCNG